MTFGVMSLSEHIPPAKLCACVCVCVCVCVCASACVHLRALFTLHKGYTVMLLCEAFILIQGPPGPNSEETAPSSTSGEDSPSSSGEPC